MKKGLILLIIILIVILIIAIIFWWVSDKTAPIISNIQVGDITDTSAAIAWHTDEDSDSIVEYGLVASDSYDFTASGDTVASGSIFFHAVGLTELEASTSYRYKVTSTDTSGNKAESSEQSFVTLATLPEILPNLTILGFNTPRNVVTGQNVTLKINVRNSGTAIAPPSTLLVVFSRTPTFQDIFTETQTTLDVPLIPPPSQDNSNTVWIDWSTVIPETTADFIYLMVKCDPDNQIVELSENDNGGGTEMIVSHP